MNFSQIQRHLQDLAAAVKEHPFRVITPLAMAVAAAVSYAALRPRYYETVQGMTLRAETGGASRPGLFGSIDEMQAAQETVLELAKSPAVARAALADIGPPSTFRLAKWPTQGDVDRVREMTTLASPKGAEFGRTEVFYLVTRDQGRDRSRLLNQALLRHLNLALQNVRGERADGLTLELEQRVAMTRHDLEDATRRMTEIEQQVGDDLAELRMLNEALAGESNLRGLHVAIKNELRQVRVAQRTNEQLLEMLQQAKQDPTRLLATPNELLQSQPGLQRLKDGLVDSQLKAAQLQGEFSPLHPKVRAAIAAQQQIRARLAGEISASLGSMSAEREMIGSRMSALERQLNEVQSRMAKVASLRASYGNLTEEVRSHAETLKVAQRALSDARAGLAASQQASGLTRVQEPILGDRPIGPGSMAILAVGLVGGLSLGLGLLVLTFPAFPLGDDFPSSQDADIEPLPSAPLAASRPNSALGRGPASDLVRANGQSLPH